MGSRELVPPSFSCPDNRGARILEVQIKELLMY